MLVLKGESDCQILYLSKVLLEKLYQIYYCFYLSRVMIFKGPLLSLGWVVTFEGAVTLAVQ